MNNVSGKRQAEGDLQVFLRFEDFNKGENAMKYMFASDIHGSAYYCKKMLEAYQQEGAQRLVLLGDLLYHGPRNDLPREYAPKAVIPMLNGMKEELYVVRGNCEAEVDQMVLEFPVLADYCILEVDGKPSIAVMAITLIRTTFLP